MARTAAWWVGRVFRRARGGQATLASFVVLVVVSMVGSGLATAAVASARPAAPRRVHTVTCPGLGELQLVIPPDAPTPTAISLPAGVRVFVGFRAVDSRTGASVSGGPRPGAIDCGGIAFQNLAATTVSNGSLPAGMLSSDRLSGTFLVSVTVDSSNPPTAPALPSKAVAAQPFPFAGALQSYLANRAGHVSVAVHDAITGATYTYAPQNTYVTASIVKVDILGTLLRQAQDARRGLTGSEQVTAAKMIEFSDNSAATSLWNAVGGGPAVGSFNGLVGMPSTVPGSGGFWGLTRTTAPDQVQLVNDVGYPNPVLNDGSRGYAEMLMHNVTSSQRWGVSGGVPAGVSVALKNGWLPISGGWEINSIGHIAGGGKDYVIAVLTAGSPTMGYGIGTVEGVSSMVWGGMAIATAIFQKWTSLGGPASVLGGPTGPEVSTPDGVGRYRAFQHGWIYWTPSTGAHEVHGAIAAEWAALGYERSVLGYPTTDEIGTPDGVGRFNHFQFGSVYWTPATGAHEVHGAIRAEWSALGWERSPLGYPKSDEASTPAVAGRFNNFQGGAIYWSPVTGAHEVHGAIYARYVLMSGPQSALGLPVSDEHDVTGGRQNEFQHGHIYWDRATNQTTAVIG